MKRVFSLLIAALMVAALTVSAFAYQSALPDGTVFSDKAKAKMASFKDGDNIMRLDDEYTGDPAGSNKSGDTQFCYQTHDAKWGRAIKDTGWTINGMAAVGDGIFDADNIKKPLGGLNFSRKDTGTVMVDVNGELVEKDGYYILCGWEFAGDFKAKGFKAYFNKDAYADDFDILAGKIVNDEIVWEVVYSAENVGSKMTDVAGTSFPIAVFEADFDKTAEGRVLQIAVKGTDGLAAPSNGDGYLGFTMPEFEVYYGEVAAAPATEPAAPATEPAAPATEPAAPATEPAAPETKPAAPSTGDNAALVIVAAVAVAGTAAVVISRRKENV